MNHILVTACVALGTVGVLAASTGGVQAGPRSVAAGGAFVVTWVSPGRNRQVLPDLSDPGVNGRVLVRFSQRPDARDLFDATNSVSGLSAKVRFEDQTLAPVPCSATLRRNELLIDPLSDGRPVLPPGRYTLTLAPSIRGGGGRRLNDGRRGFTAAFSIGAGEFPPVLQRTSPADGQRGVALRRPIVLSFDDPIDGASAAASIRLEDRTASPPTSIPVQVILRRDGREVVVAPDPALGYPPGADLTLVVSGRGTATPAAAPVLTDAAGQAFTRDAGSHWIEDPVVPTLFHSRLGTFDEDTGEFAMTFRTRVAPRAANR